VISVTAPMALAADIVAGEKERNSLEILISTGVSRISILLGKYFAVVTFGLGGAASFITGMFISLQIDSSVIGIPKIVVTINQIILFLVIIVVSVLLLSSIEILISIIARSTKEAQLYTIPLTIIMIGISTYSENTYFLHNNSDFLYCFPPLNIIHLLRDSIMNDTTVINILVTILSVILLTSVVLFTGSLLLLNEKIIYRN
jgi:sodium transport system permease protein